VHFPQVEAWHVARLASVEWSAGHVDKARQTAQRARSLARRARFLYAEAMAERIVGQILRAESLAGARSHLAIAVDMFTRIDARYDAVLTRLELADVDRVLGRGMEARAERDRCLAELAVMGVSRANLTNPTLSADGAHDMQGRPAPSV
jgi:hypothetical protein